ncbi:hypothetical protein LXL04_021780 [Taraxacum kok-saghyz]
MATPPKPWKAVKPASPPSPKKNSVLATSTSSSGRLHDPSEASWVSIVSLCHRPPCPPVIKGSTYLQDSDIVSNHFQDHRVKDGHWWGSKSMEDMIHNESCQPILGCLRKVRTEDSDSDHGLGPWSVRLIMSVRLGPRTRSDLLRRTRSAQKNRRLKIDL